jgi:TMEM175 potassium channel family protein
MDEKETGRLEAFSDGVFAVAITLLVLGIKIPDQLPQTNSEVIDILFGQDHWPALIAYVTSFATIGIMWLNHHRLFVHIKRTDTGLMLLNLLLLLVIVFIPVPTALLAESFNNPTLQAPAIIYGGTNMIMAVCFNLLWRYASYHNRLLGKNVDPRSVRAISGQYLFGPLLYLITIIVAWFSTISSVVLIFILALFFAAPPRPLRNLPREGQRAAGGEQESGGGAR